MMSYAQHMMSFVTKKKREKDVGIVTFDLPGNWFSSHQSHYCLYYSGIPEFVRKSLVLTVK